MIYDCRLPIFRSAGIPTRRGGDLETRRIRGRRISNLLRTRWQECLHGCGAFAIHHLPASIPFFRAKSK
jgi:hypothetical protein